jgi:hypothetical protein
MHRRVAASSIWLIAFSALFAVISLSSESSVMAKGLCTGSRECPMTVAVADAQKSWTNCLWGSTAIQVRKTDDLNAAVEAALAACATEEDAVFSLLQTESNLTLAEAMKFRPILRAKLKSDTLELLQNGPKAEDCRRALREGRSTC